VVARGAYSVERSAVAAGCVQGGSVQGDPPERWDVGGGWPYGHGDGDMRLCGGATTILEAQAHEQDETP